MEVIKPKRRRNYGVVVMDHSAVDNLVQEKTQSNMLEVLFDVTGAATVKVL
jgi:hypothetical protein